MKARIGLAMVLSMLVAAPAAAIPITGAEILGAPGNPLFLRIYGAQGAEDFHFTGGGTSFLSSPRIDFISTVSGFVVGTGDGGTSDPFVFAAIYGGPGSHSGPFSAGNGGGSGGGGMVSLNWQNPLIIPGAPLGQDVWSTGPSIPIITGVTDSGLVTANLSYWNWSAPGDHMVIEKQWQLALTDAPLQVVPEPTTVVLLGSGLAAVAIRRWRGRRHEA